MTLLPDDVVTELRKRPFEPFRIHVDDGATYEIRHPDFVLVGPTRLVIFVPMPGKPFPLFQRYDTVALAHITRFEPLEPQVAANN